MKILDPQYGNNFVGREEETKELKEKIENNGIVVIKGGRGIGKTNLMKVVEEDSKKRKECHYIEDGLLFSAEVSRFFLPDQIITGASGSVTILGFGGGSGTSWKPREPSVLEYMEKSEEKMIFVENAQDLKKEEFATIFAATRRNTRLRFILEIATPYKPEDKLGVVSYEVVELNGLRDKDIKKIMRRECPNFSDAIVKRIVFLSNGYPYIARSIAYVCDSKNTEKEMFEFLETLRDDDMKHNLDRIHKEVLETLNENSQGVTKRLAIAPAILTFNLIEAFCGEGMDTSLNDIIERGILVKLEENFYQLYHPLFREYLRHIQPVALKNKKRIYCEVMEEVKSKLDSIYILFEVFNEPDIFEELIELTENYKAINCVGFQSFTWGELGLALCAWNRLLEISRGISMEWEAIAIGNMGALCQVKGELDKALEYYEKALKLDEELGRKEGIAADLGNIGIVYRHKGELNLALEHFEKALKLYEKLGRKEGMAASLGNIGIVYGIKGKLDKALEYYKRALKLNEELGIEEGIANQLGNIGNVYLDRGEPNKALEHYERALKLNEELERKEGIAIQLANIGTVYLNREELDKALEYFEEALELDEELEIKEGLAADFGNIGIAYVNKGELGKALEYYEKGLQIFKEVGDRISTARTLMNIGDVLIRKGEKEDALDYYLEAQDFILDHDYSLFEDISKRINILLGANKNAQSHESN
jgi:tetratricopeptide (TPR) repeat protein